MHAYLYMHILIVLAVNRTKKLLHDETVLSDADYKPRQLKEAVTV